MSSRGGHRVHSAAILPLAITCALAVLTVACNGDKKNDGGTAGPTTTVAPTTTSAPKTPEEQVLDDYRKGWDAFLVALDPPNPQHPDFLRYTTGDALNQSRLFMLELQAQGQVVRGTSEYNARLVSLEGDRAVVDDCAVDGGLKYDAATGALRSDPKPARVGYRTEMARELGTWKHARVVEVQSLCS